MSSKVLYFYLSQDFHNGYTIHIEKDNLNPEFDDHLKPEDYVKIEFPTVNTEWKYKLFIICYFPTENIIYEKTLESAFSAENADIDEIFDDEDEMKKIEDIISDDDDDAEYFYIIMDNNYEVISKNMINV
jgi:hypothetical protein